MSNKVKNRVLWDSRLAYISATIDMVVGFGALWCLLMVFAQNNGGAFALAYELIPLGFNIYYLIVIGWVFTYTFYAFKGAYIADSAGFYNTFSFDIVLAGFTTISAIVLFNMDLASGIGLMFTFLSKVFDQMPGTLFMAFGFLIALFFVCLQSGELVFTTKTTFTIMKDIRMVVVGLKLYLSSVAGNEAGAKVVETFSHIIPNLALVMPKIDM